MATAARKARKRAGIKAPVKPAKVATPLEERSDLNGVVPGLRGTRYFGQFVPRSVRRLQAARTARGLDPETGAQA